jgi:PAS domain S-box-containing protein
VTITRHAGHRAQPEELHQRLAEAEEMLRAIQQGDIDALVIERPGGSQVYTLHNAEEPYRNLVEQMQEGAVVLTTHGDILFSNARFAALVGEPLEAVAGSRFERFVHTSDEEDVEALLRAGSGRRRCRLLGRASGPCEVSLSLTTTRSAHGDRRNLIVTDMTELLEAHISCDRAARDSRTKDEFLALLAHELRNPLNAIRTAAGVLKATRAEGRPATLAHDVIARQVSHITHLIDDLVDIERVVSGKIRLNPQRLDMTEVVRRAVATVVADVHLNRQIDVSTDPACIDGDPVRIEQVMTNILANAVKYTPSGGHIRVTLAVEGADAVVSVADSGFGISASLLPHIFDMYVQADQTIDRARGGLGIGLALVRQLVELHGGTVTASSDGEGQGSTFTMRFRAVPPAERPGSTFPAERRAHPRRVLLIEDSGEAREKLRTMLELAGHQVYAAADAARGIEVVNAEHPDVGIIDVELSAMDGYQVARRLREQPHGRGMLLLALNGNGPAGGSNHSVERGFDHHLAQPVDANHLDRLIGERVARF